MIFGALGQVVQDTAGRADTTVPVPALPQDLQTTLRARQIVSEAVQNAGNNTIYGSGGQNILIGGSGSNSIQGGNERDLIFGHDVLLDRSAVPIAAETWSGNTATVTTRVTNDFVSGESITVAGVAPLAYNGTYVITVTGPTTFTYTLPLAANPGAGTAFGTVTHLGNFSNPPSRGSAARRSTARPRPPGPGPGQRRAATRSRRNRAGATTSSAFSIRASTPSPARSATTTSPAAATTT